MKHLLVVLLFFCPTLFAANDYPSQMEGLYYIWGDPVEKNDEPGVEGFTIFLEGEAAQRLFRKFESVAKYNECRGDGTLTKYAGNIKCSVSPENRYQCAFSVNVKEQKISRAETC